LSFFPSSAAAHSNGCHSAHSCPSDHHTYIWYDGAGQGWSCARPGSSSYDPSRDTTTISYGGYTYYCYRAGSPPPPPPPADSDADGVPDSSDGCSYQYAATINGCPAAPAPPPQAQDFEFGAVITRVIDGDTVVVRAGSNTVKVRLLGIDAPETYRRRECGGREASRAMKRLARRGEPVRLRTDSTQSARDRYGRLLAYVWGDDGKLMQTQMLAAGRAKTYVFRRRFKRYNSFRSAQRRASRRKRGVYRSCRGNFHRRIRR